MIIHFLQIACGDSAPQSQHKIISRPPDEREAGVNRIDSQYNNVVLFSQQFQQQGFIKTKDVLVNGDKRPSTTHDNAPRQKQYNVFVLAPALAHSPRSGPRATWRSGNVHCNSRRPLALPIVPCAMCHVNCRRCRDESTHILEAECIGSAIF